MPYAPSENLTDEESEAFQLSSTSTEAQHEFSREKVGRTIGKCQRKQFHQAVNVKIPYADHGRVPRVGEGWELDQTNLDRIFFDLIPPILESPLADLHPLLEEHGNKVRTRQANEAMKCSRLTSLLQLQRSMF